jgi:hypothetical protein
MGAVGKVSTTVLKLSISLKTAKALGLTIPTPLRGDSMADISEFSIITYERKTGVLARRHYPEGQRWKGRRRRQGA